MFAADRLLNLIRGSGTASTDASIDLPDTTRRIIELSDEISAVNKRIRLQSLPGSPDDIADRERLKQLMEELQTCRPNEKP